MDLDTIEFIEEEYNVNAIQIGGTHYKTNIQCWDYIVANDIGFLAGNAIKYITRYKKKNGIADLEKAIHYLEKLIEVEKNGTN